MSDQVIKLTLDARFLLGHEQSTLGRLLGVSRRTVQRWDSGHGGPDASQLAMLAAAVAPKDRRLAAKLAVAAGTSLEQLGLAERPASPPAPLPAPAATTPAATAPVAIAPQHLVDVVVCATAEALNVPPPAVRPALLAAFRKAHDVGLTVEDVATVLGRALGQNSKPRR